MESNQQGLGNIKSNWYVWLFPFIALCICGFLLFHYLMHRGPRIKISFEDGANIQPEKTEIRFRGVPIGMVRDVEISKDKKEVIAVVDLQKDAKGLAVEGTKFWIVTPRVSLQGVSGLETIIGGPYIALTPGKNEGKPEKEFKGRLGPNEADESQEDTVSYFLETPTSESINIGDAVTFRGLKIGTVTKIALNKTGQLVQIQINIQNHYVRLIRTNTVFWRKTALQAHLSIFKSEIKMSSLESMLKGGVERFTPTDAGEIAKAQTKFALQNGPPKDSDKWNPNLENK